MVAGPRDSTAIAPMTSADPERQQRYRKGHVAEWLAAGLLIAKGYRILARRHRTRFGEIDLIAVRGRRIAFVEVKRRATRDEAFAALEGEQSRRVAAAAEAWMARNQAYMAFDWGFDAILIVPGRWPLHVVDGLRD
jgi:putative endonuclease